MKYLVFYNENSISFFSCSKPNEQIDDYKPIKVAYTGYEKEFLDSLNSIRNSYGIDSLKSEKRLTYLAKTHSDYMDAIKKTNHDYFYSRFLESESERFGEIYAYNYITAASEISMCRIYKI